LASCRFIAKKNLTTLIDAYADYRSALAAAADDAHAPWDLVVLGDGELRDQLNALRHQRGMDSCVHFPGFRQYDELPAYYSLASAFIHASTVEPWGLVVNEAMASGLPVLVSDRCGCAPTLVRAGENGQSFGPADTQAITARMLEMTRLSPEQRQAMGCRSRQIIAEWGPAKFAEGLHSAATSALASPARSARLVDRFVLQALLRKGVPRRIAG
jgi:1,2-diacylglycerol 3-alpha-glucosyltransferase